jgi:hypothetical protein
MRAIIFAPHKFFMSDNTTEAEIFTFLEEKPKIATYSLVKYEGGITNIISGNQVIGQYIE